TLPPRPLLRRRRCSRRPPAIPARRRETAGGRRRSARACAHRNRRTPPSQRLRVFPGIARIRWTPRAARWMMNGVIAPSAPVRESTHRRFRLAVVVASVVVAIVGSVLLARHHSGEKVTTQGVTATLHVPGHPGWVAAGPDALWLALSSTQIPVRDR